MVAARYLVLTAVALAVAAIAAGAYLWSGYLGTSGLPTVDFSKVAPGDGKSGRDTRPELRVAIAAMVSPEMTKQYYEDLLRLIGDKMGMKVVFVQRKTYAEVNDLVEERRVDLAFVCSGPYVTGNEKFGMEIVAVPVVKGEKYYHSYIIAGKDSTINSLADLRGKRFAFTDPDSNTGCLVPRYMLAQRGETPETFFKYAFYTHSHDNSIRAVADGRADGAAVDSLIWEFLDASDPQYTRLTKVVEKSPPYGIPPVVVPPDADSGLKRRLREVLMTLDRDPRGKAILVSLGIERFDAPDRGAYEEVKRMQDWLAGGGR